MTEPVELAAGALALADIKALRGDAAVALAAESLAAIDAGHGALGRLMAEGHAVYGVNTGFGSLSTTRIAEDQMRELQRRLVRSNAVGSGPLLPDPVVRRLMLLKINALACGRSGVRRALVEHLVAMLNAGVLPCIPSKGSVGASGDLAPMAHLALAMIGEGEVRVAGASMPARDGLGGAGLAPLVLDPKEGLSLVNGTETSTALGLEALFALEAVFAAALVAGAMVVDGAQGRSSPFDARLHAARGQPGEIELAALYRDLLGSSEMRTRAEAEGRIQDPYSLRCQPQVMGACLDHLRFAAGVYAREANSVADNPLIFAEDEAVVFGGNFHAAPVAMAADVLAIVIAELGAASERRIAHLVDAAWSGLAPFLVAESGLNSGFMAAQIAAAALASENKSLAHPASVDSIPTVANFEDHVSMATYANRRLLEMVENAATIVGIELLCAAQAFDLRRPLRSSERLEAAHGMVRAVVPALGDDRYLAPEIDAARALVLDGAFLPLLPAGLLPSG